MKIKKKIILGGQIISVALSLFLINFMVFAWTSPITNPPDGNVEAPLHVGSASQTKSGELTVGALTVVGTITAEALGLSNCDWTSATCDNSATCPAHKFVAGIQRHTGETLCGTAPTQWYQQSIYCCNL
jgi:hypothetical protein